MTKMLNIAEAKARLSEIVREAANGKEILIGRRGVPLVRLVPVAGAPKRKLELGTLKGLIRMADDFEDPLEDFADYM